MACRLAVVWGELLSFLLLASLVVRALVRHVLMKGVDGITFGISLVLHATWESHLYVCVLANGFL